MVDQPAQGAARRYRILVADDESGILGFLAHALASAGYETLLARDGNEALDLLHGPGADLLLLDLWMPRLSGFEVARKLAGNGQRPPVIAMSAAYNPERDGPLEDTIVAFLPKPFDLQELLDLVQRHLPAGEAA
jgi:CheY-like chemotaxis protein